MLKLTFTALSHFHNLEFMSNNFISFKVAFFWGVTPGSLAEVNGRRRSEGASVIRTITHGPDGGGLQEEVIGISYIL
jgi:hypothetical protein